MSRLDYVFLGLASVLVVPGVCSFTLGALSNNPARALSLSAASCWFFVLALFSLFLALLPKRSK